MPMRSFTVQEKSGIKEFRILFMTHVLINWLDRVTDVSMQNPLQYHNIMLCHIFMMYHIFER